MDEAASLVGIERVHALHASDSRDARGSHRDRHWHLGQGEIGETGFQALFRDKRLRDTPVVLETPGDADDDRANLARARELSSKGG